MIGDRQYRDRQILLLVIGDRWSAPKILIGASLTGTWALRVAVGRRLLWRGVVWIACRAFHQAAWVGLGRGVVWPIGTKPSLLVQNEVLSLRFMNVRRSLLGSQVHQHILPSIVHCLTLGWCLTSFWHCFMFTTRAKTHMEERDKSPEIQTTKWCKEKTIWNESHSKSV